MAETEFVEIEMSDMGNFKIFLATPSKLVSCNVIEKGRLDALHQSWVSLSEDMTYEFNGEASPPLGLSEVTWGWKGTTRTWDDIFIVVEKTETSTGIILGDPSRQRPRVASSDDLFPCTMERQSRGTSIRSHLYQSFADNSLLAERKAQEDAARRADDHNANEKAEQDAQSRARKEKRKEKRENERTA